MTEKPNVLRITGAGSIVLRNSNTTRAGFSWTGTALRHSTGRMMRFTPAVTAEIAHAVATSHQAVYEQRTGAEIQGGDRDGWAFVGVQGDAIGHYARLVQPAVIARVAFSKDDVVGYDAH